MPEPEPNLTGDPTPTPPAGTPTPPATAVHKIVVDGVEKEMTLDELTIAAQKGAGADRRFQEAADIRKAASDGIRTQELFRSLSSGTQLSPQDAAELAGLVGGEAEDFIIEENEPDQQFDNVPTVPNTPARKITLEDLDPSLKNNLELSNTQHQQKLYDDLKVKVKNIVDTNSFSGKMVEDYPEDRRNEVKEVLFDLTFEDVSKKILARQPFGPEMVQLSLQRVGSLIKRLGIPSKGGAEQAGSQPIITGLGPSGGEIDTEIHAEKPIERVAATDDEYADNFVKRLAQRLAKK